MTTHHAVAVTVLLAAAVVPVANADIINVPGDQPTIQAGIDAAMNGDEVVVAPGSYFERIDFLGKAITVRSSDGPEVTTIDAQQVGGAVVKCVGGEGPDTVLDGFTVTGGDLSNGAGMRNVQSSPTVTSCVFSGNSASFGGGMKNIDSSPTVSNCTFSANSGGGMANDSSNPTLTDCTFSGNSASRGGGMFNDSGSSPTVSNCTFSENTANTGGGGMINDGSSPMVTNCTFSGNTALSGGGMKNVFSSSATVTNCTFSDNTAVERSGGIDITADSSVTVTNCVLWGNMPEQIVSDGTNATTYSDVQGGWPGTGNINEDPSLVDPDNADLRLQPGSPCIDAGDNTAVPEDITTDLDGNPRFVDDPNTIDSGNGDPPMTDMGAYEFQGGALCPWDCDSGESIDGTVGIVDFLTLLGQWGGPGSCDFDGGGVGITDFLELLANWGPCP